MTETGFGPRGAMSGRKMKVPDSAQDQFWNISERLRMLSEVHEYFLSLAEIDEVNAFLFQKVSEACFFLH